MLIPTSTAGKLKLYHVVDPTDAEHAANQRYVDSKASRANRARHRAHAGAW